MGWGLRFAATLGLGVVGGAGACLSRRVTIRHHVSFLAKSR